jgi:hypothetical protein
VPGDPSQPGESEALRRAASTWSGEWWKAGGGGSPWDPIVYDPDLDLVYVGTGNGAPWYDKMRGKGDDLYVDLPVSFYDLALGGEVNVPTLSGQVAMTMLRSQSPAAPSHAAEAPRPDAAE